MSMEALFLRYLNLSLRACWLILFILLIRAVFSRAPGKYRFFLWAALGLRLLCPLTFESAVSLLPKGDAVPMDISMSRIPQIDTGVRIINQTVNPVLISRFAPSPGDSVNPLQVWNYIASIVWIAGMACLILYLVISSVLIHNRMKEAVLLYDNIYESERTDSAFVFGILKPKIYLPLHLSDSEKRYIIAHEKGHIAHGDHILKPLAFLVLSVHWYNPLVWLAYRLFTRDIEYACDETVLSGLSENEHADYAAVLLKSAARGHLMISPAAFGESDVKGRIRTVLDYRKPSFRAGIVLLVCAVIAAVSFLSDPVKKEERTEPDPIPDVTPEPAAEKTLEVEEERTEEPYTVHYRTSDKAYIDRFETLLATVMNADDEGIAELNADGEYDNIMDFRLDSGAGFFSFQAGRFPHGSVMYENVLYVEAGTKTGGKVTARRAYLIPADSETAKEMQEFVNEIRSASSSQTYDPARDPESIRTAMNRLGSPEEYGIPFCKHFEMSNMEAWDEFMNLVNAGIPCSTYVASYTIEGDIIYSYLQYDGNDFFFAVDSSRDKFGGDEDFFYTQKKHISYVQDVITDESDGRKFDTYTAVLADEQYGTYEEIRQAQLREDDVWWIWGFQKVHEN